MTTLKVKRISVEPMSSVAVWFRPDGTRICYCLEPGLKRVPHPGIPEGDYALRLRSAGSKHAAYKARYDADPKFGPGWHKGMIEIVVPGRVAIEWHVGDYLADTEGCSLAGETFARGVDGHWTVGASRTAYEKNYPYLRDLILAGPTRLVFIETKAG